MAREVWIYKLTSPSGKVYIGQTVDPIARFKQYARENLKYQKRLRSSLMHYGWENHKAEILFATDKIQADYAERYLIRYYESDVYGLNTMPGGPAHVTKEMGREHSTRMTGRKMSTEHKNKISNTMRGRPGKKGAVRSQEFKDKIRNHILSLDHLLKKPVDAYTPDGIFVKTYYRTKELKSDGLDRTCISKMLAGKEGRDQHKGFKFKYHGC